MAELNTVTGTRTGTVAVDEGLRAYMLRVYNYMAAGLAITGIVAYLVFELAVTKDAGSAVATVGKNGIMLTEFGRLVFVSPLKWVLLLAPLALVFFMSARIHKMSVQGGQLTFWIYAALVGASIASIFLVYAHGSIARLAGLVAVAAVGAIVAAHFAARLDDELGALRTRPEVARAADEAKRHSLAVVRVEGVAPAAAREVERATRDASVSAFRVGIVISAVLMALGGLLGLVGVRNPRREVSAEGCAGGQLAGSPQEAARQSPCDWGRPAGGASPAPAAQPARSGSA